MAAAYLDDFVQELQRVGEVAFRRRHTTPVLIVTGRATRGVRAVVVDDVTGPAGPGAEPATGRRSAPLALIHRVFPVVKAAQAPSGPITVGRTSENDVVIPEYSISKRHCTFEQRDGAVTISDAGSTNGTLLNGAPLEGRSSIPLCGGEIITMGRFTFVYETPAGFIEYVAGLVVT
jgi:hypothetical protein